MGAGNDEKIITVLSSVDRKHCVNVFYICFRLLTGYKNLTEVTLKVLRTITEHTITRYLTGSIVTTW